MSLRAPRKPARAEPPGVSLNGQRLDKVYMQFVEGTYPGSVSSLGFPASHIVLRRDGEGFTLVVPPVLAAQIFAAGIVGPLPQAYADLHDGAELHRGLRLAWVRCCKRSDGREGIALRFEPVAAHAPLPGDAPALGPRSPRQPRRAT